MGSNFSEDHALLESSYDDEAPESLLTVSHEDIGDGIFVVKVQGLMDLASEFKLRQETAELITDGHIHLILDLLLLKYIDSSGLAAILSTLRRVRERDGSLRIVNERKSVARVFSLTGVDKLIEVYTDLSVAIDAAKKGLNS